MKSSFLLSLGLLLISAHVALSATSTTSDNSDTSDSAASGGPTLGDFPQVLPHMLWPIPAQYTYGTNNITISNPCGFTISVTASPVIPQIAQLINIYKPIMFPSSVCASFSGDSDDVTDATDDTADDATTDDDTDNATDDVTDNVTDDATDDATDATDDATDNVNVTAANNVLNVHITNSSQYLMNYGANESYTLTVQDGSFTLTTATYLGFVRGLETFSQLLTYTTVGKKTTVSIPFTPVTIVDEPRFTHRGIMVDTARHFISKQSLFQVMDAMLSLKLNVFHWHISDSDSFPMYMPTHPNLNLYGAFSANESYSQQDVQDIVNYAIVRGIKITPEVDSPSHTSSWAFDPEFSSLFTCWESIWYTGIPFGQIDPSADASYNLVSDIIKDLESYFPWDTIHLGSDEVYGTCWNTPSINSFMQSNGIANYNELFQYYVNRTSQFVSSGRSRVYWSNPDTSFLQFQPNDIIQWWGNMTGLPDGLATYPSNKVILSNYDYLYMDCGMGNYFGNPTFCDPFHTWADIYSFEPAGYLTDDQMANILGFEAALWGELDNDSVIINKLFPRAGSLAEKAWSPLQNDYNSNYSVFVRLNAWINRVAGRGIDCQPISAGYCEMHPEMCFT